jgi:hypothetical protein
MTGGLDRSLRCSVLQAVKRGTVKRFEMRQPSSFGGKTRRAPAVVAHPVKDFADRVGGEPKTGRFTPELWVVAIAILCVFATSGDLGGGRASTLVAILAATYFVSRR